MAAADQLGADAIVTHVGSHQGAGFEAGLERVQAGAAPRPRPRATARRVRVLLENTAGAGGTMGVDFEELAAIIDAVDGDPRLGLCLDTRPPLRGRLRPAHARGPRRDARASSTPPRPRPPRRCSTSTTPRRRSAPTATATRTSARASSAADGFRTIVNHPAFADLPGILEVPGFDGQGPDQENLARLRALVAG